jgi:hypothetical protein
VATRVVLGSIELVSYILHCVDLELVNRRKDRSSGVGLKSSGCAIAQAVIRRLPGFESGLGHMEFVVDKAELGQVFS